MLTSSLILRSRKQWFRDPEKNATIVACYVVANEQWQSISITHSSKRGTRIIHKNNEWSIKGNNNIKPLYSTLHCNQKVELKEKHIKKFKLLSSWCRRSVLQFRLQIASGVMVTLITSFIPSPMDAEIWNFSLPQSDVPCDIVLNENMFWNKRCRCATLTTTLLGLRWLSNMNGTDHIMFKRPYPAGSGIFHETTPPVPFAEYGNLWVIYKIKIYNKVIFFLRFSIHSVIRILQWF